MLPDFLEIRLILPVLLQYQYNGNVAFTVLNWYQIDPMLKKIVYPVWQSLENPVSVALL